MLSRVGSRLYPKLPKAWARLSAKKLKYLNTPKKPRFTPKLSASQNFF